MLKYQKYFLVEPQTNLVLPEYRGKPTYTKESGITRVVDLSSKVIENAACSIGTTWIWPKSDITDKISVQAHIHPFVEVLGFFGTNPDDDHDLCGEVEIWIEDEKYIMTRSFMVYIPPGIKHCPLIVRRVERPIFHFGVVPSNEEYV